MSLGYGLRAVFISLLMLAMTACHRDADRSAVNNKPMPPSATAFYANHFSRVPTAAEMTALGRKLFFDASLSASGKLACSSCHDPSNAFGPPDGVSVRAGGGQMQATGVRATPSLRYLQNVPSFTEHFFEESKDESEDQGPVGGHTWDGRAASVHDQARLPLLSPNEMANRSADEVVQRVSHSESAAQFRAVFGEDVFKDAALAFNGVLMALEVFQQSPRDFYPYSSRYDAWLRGQGKLTSREMLGLRLFNNPQKGNCASCHPSQIAQGAFPQFTDFGYAAIAVPRNAELAANHDRTWHDLGLCGPLRSDLAQQAEYCGLFRVPSLRNVATRRVFFHNGVLHDLHRVVEFYVDRDLHPQKWYGKDAQGQVQMYDDLPAAHYGNVNHEAPFDRKAGDRPALTHDEIDAVVTFLGTLTDADLQPAARVASR
jgi:cytochrome c peroxidase